MPSAKKKPNAWGLYDMVENIAELVDDGDTCLGGGSTSSEPEGGNR